MGKYFGTDGVRGVANIKLTPELTYKLGRCFAYYALKNNKKEDKLNIVIGLDTRISADMLEASLVAAICSVGANAVCAKVIQTPAIPYIIKKYKLDGGIMISASHNHFKDNGIKFFDKNGFKLNEDEEDKIEYILENEYQNINYAISENIGIKKYLENAKQDYINFLKTTIDGDFANINIAIDCANGATYKTAPELFKMLKANVTALFTEPDGININENCGSTAPNNLINEVKKGSFDLGIAFDGDGDRCIAVDENGEIVDGDQIMSICANYLKSCNKLKNNTFVATIVSNLGLFIFGENNNINVLKANVGDKYVLEEMLKNNCNFGGEQSGHIIFLDYNTTGDGLLTAIQLINIIKKTGKKLSELKKVINILPQIFINVKVDNDKKYAYLKNEKIKNAIKNLENKVLNKGRLLIRPSGTEPLIRIMLESDDTDFFKKDLNNLASLIEENLK